MATASAAARRGRPPPARGRPRTRSTRARTDRRARQHRRERRQLLLEHRPRAADGLLHDGVEQQREQHDLDRAHVVVAPARAQGPAGARSRSRAARSRPPARADERPLDARVPARPEQAQQPEVQRREGAQLKADPVLFGVEPHVDDLREVDVDVGVLGLELNQRSDPESVSAFLKASWALVTRTGSTWPPWKPMSMRRGGYQPSVALRASTSSVSTPPVDFGCRNATRLPRMPMRGRSSIS